MQYLKLIPFLLFPLSVIQIISAQDQESRYKNFDVTSYSFRIELNDSTNTIHGEAAIRLEFRQITDTVFLDLVNLNAEGKGMVINEISDKKGIKSFTHRNSQVGIPSPESKENGSAEYLIKYHGIPADGLIISRNKFGNRTFFGDNWPNRAHNWLPCVDHPADKALLEFIIKAPSHYQIVSNGTCTGETIDKGILTSNWKTNIPLPTKLMVIGVAEFSIQELSVVSGVPVSTYVYPQNKNEGFSDYAVAVKPLLYYSKIIAPFPFEKLANVQSTTLYGGMENAGCIFYSENSVTGMGNAERLIAHEIAHQWFGDAVSEKDWYHIWLSEGFATYLTGMYIEQTYGRGPFLRHINAEKDRVFRFEKIKYSAIIDSGLSVSDDLLSPNTYYKSSWVLHMLRKELGDSLFVMSLKTFYKDFEYKNALTNDFKNVVEKLSGRDFSRFFEQWIYKPGHPVLDISWTYKDHKLILDIRQVQENTIFEFPLELKIINRNSVSTQHRLDIKDPEHRFIFDCPAAPIDIIPDPGNWLLIESFVKKDDSIDLRQTIQNTDAW